MLVLTRNAGQDIIINGNIQVRILNVHDGRVRIGIVAPRDVPVHRSEVQEKIAKELPEKLAPPNLG